MSNNTSDEFWLNDPAVLFKNGNFYKFFPTSGMTKNEILNSLTLFFIYLEIVLLLFSVDTIYLYIPLVAIVAIIVWYYIDKNENKENIKENIKEELLNHSPQNFDLDRDTDDYINQHFYSESPVINDRDSFARWTYQPEETCKENPSKCLKYEDIRYHRYNSDYDTPEF